VRIQRAPDTFVGADLVYISPEHAGNTLIRSRFIEGPPVLIVEILSPSDTVEDITEMVEQYLNAGVSIVWEVNPYFERVTVHHLGMPREIFNEDQDPTAAPHLPGFRAPVGEVFAG
jgi:Uma2 family endonuclease